MTNQRILELLKIERECVARGNTCGRTCATCELVQDDKELLEMYDTLIRERKKMEEIYDHNYNTFKSYRVDGLLWDGEWCEAEYLHDGMWENKGEWHPRGLRAQAGILDDWCGMTNEEIMEVYNNVPSDKTPGNG